MTSPTLNDSVAMRTRVKRAVREFKPKLWLDGSYDARNAGAREFVVGSEQCFTLATKLNPGTSSFWLSFWSRSATVSATPQAFVSTNSSTSTESGFAAYQTTTPLFRFNDDGAAASVLLTVADTTLAVNTWYHHVYLVNRTAGTITAWVNGVLSSSSADISGKSGPCTPIAAYASTIAAAWAGSDRWVNGRLSRIAFGYGVLPTVTEIAELYHGGSGKAYRELSAALAAKVVYAWDCEEATGSLLSSATANTGTASVSAPTVSGGPALIPSVNGLGVSGWTSRDAAHVPLLQNVIAGRPVYTAATKSVTFDGTNDYLTKATATLTGNTGRVAITCATGEVDELQVLYSQSDIAGATAYLHLGINADNVMYYAFNNGGTAKILTGETALSTDVHILEWASDGSTISMWVDGQPQSVTEGTAGDNDGDWFGDVTDANNSTIGASIDDTGTAENPFTGSIQEIVALEPDDTSSNATRLRRTLARLGAVTLASGIGLLLADGSGIILADGTGLLLG